MSKKKQSQPEPVSKILLEETFSAGDDRFVFIIKKLNSAKLLAGFADRWLADRRPWAREQIIVYLEGDLNLPGHEAVFRRIFKHFIAAEDHEMMGVLMVVLDRMVRRSRVTSHHYDWSNRSSWTTERLLAKANKSIRDVTGRTAEYRWGGKTATYPLPDLLNKSSNVIFSHKTRNYFRRAAWRYFRFLSYREPKTFVQEVSRALARYQDRDFFLGENIIDNWSLMHACYFHHDAIQFSAAHTNLVEGKSLTDLSPAPYQPETWKTESAGDALVQLLIDAKSTLVRIWAIELFTREHEAALKNIKLEFLVQLLGSPDPNLQEFASNIFDKHPALPTLTVKQWLDLINGSSANLLPPICDAMTKHVSEDRLDNKQIIELASAQQDPVSQMGFKLLQSRDEKKALSADELQTLAECRCTSQTSSIATWALARICERGPYESDRVIDFFDAELRPTRNAAMKWLREPQSLGYDDAKLWAQLIESPYDDVKIELVELLSFREKGSRKNEPTKTAETMAPVWVSVILGVHRGGRTKPKAINQLTDQIASKPASADNLLPVLAVALRSIRAPEMRAALTAVVRLASESPEMKSKVESAFPELEFIPEEATS